MSISKKDLPVLSKLIVMHWKLTRKEIYKNIHKYYLIFHVNTHIYIHIRTNKSNYTLSKRIKKPNSNNLHSHPKP